MFADLDAIVMGAFGEPIIWRRHGGAESEVRAVCDIDSVDDQGADGHAGSSNEVWTLSIPASSLPFYDRLKDRFVVKGKLCKAAREPFTDAAGMMFILLAETSS